MHHPIPSHRRHPYITNRPLHPNHFLSGALAHLCREWELRARIQCPHLLSIYYVLITELGAGRDWYEPEKSPPLWSTKLGRLMCPHHQPFQSMKSLQPTCSFLKETTCLKKPFSCTLSLQSVAICNIALFTRWHFSCLSFRLLPVSIPLPFPLEVAQSLVYRRP